MRRLRQLRARGRTAPMVPPSTIADATRESFDPHEIHAPCRCGTCSWKFRAGNVVRSVNTRRRAHRPATSDSAVRDFREVSRFGGSPPRHERASAAIGGRLAVAGREVREREPESGLQLPSTTISRSRRSSRDWSACRRIDPALLLFTYAGRRVVRVHGVDRVGGDRIARIATRIGDHHRMTAGEQRHE